MPRPFAPSVHSEVQILPSAMKATAFIERLHIASHEAARLVQVGPGSSLCPIAIAIHCKSDLQMWPTLKRCTWAHFVPALLPCRGWHAWIYVSQSWRKKPCKPALKHTHCLMLTLFGMWWQLFIGVWEKQMNEEAVPGGFCQLLTITSNLLFLKQTWCLLWMMWCVGVVSISKN